MRQNSALSLSKSLSKSLFRNLRRVDRAWVIATDRCTSFYSVRNICHRLTSCVVTNPCTSTVSSSMPNGVPLRRISICNNVCYSTIIGLTFTCLAHVPNGHASSISYVVKHLIWIYRTVKFSHLNKIIERTFRFVLLSLIPLGLSSLRFYIRRTYFHFLENYLRTACTTNCSSCRIA